MTQVSSQGDISQPDDTSKRQCTSNTDIRMDASMNSMEGNNDEMWFLDDDYVVEDEEQLVDEGEHDIPFNVTDVPQQLVTADAHTQREVHLGLYEQQPASGRDHVMKFKATVGLLRQRHRIMMDDTQMQVLPFNPEGWMMALGTCMDEQLWLAMVPNMYFKEGYGENREEVVPVLESKTTVLSMEHRHPLHRGVSRTADVGVDQGIDRSSRWMDDIYYRGRFEERHQNIKLRLNDMKAFHRHFINSWAEWVRKAPASWKQDGFLVENMPVGVCLQYGQNQPIMVSQAVEEERTNWSRDRNFSYLDVQRWHNMSLERITQNHGEVYDKPDHDLSRVAVDLRELDLLDEDGYEINVYNKAGWRVPRRVPKESELCGALLDLDKVHELFQGRDEVHGEMTNEVEFWVYPLAFMWKYGNVKAHGIIPNMAARIGKLNELIFRGGMEDDDMDVDEGGEDRVQLARRHPVIRGIASQIYNSLLHWVRNEAKFHSVQLGMITSAFTGAGIETAGGQRQWEKQMEFCNGGSIYEEIICPLLKAWSHLQVLGRIKDSLKLFKADIIPELFKCVMYLVTALIEMIWAKHKQDLQDKRNIDACTVEVMSMLERTLNFTHTGNAAVLSTRLMDRAWLSLGLLSDGFPALLDTFIAHGALSMGQVTVRRHEWPVEAETRRPMMSSKQAQQLTYGKAHYEAYEAKFTIKLAIENLLPNAYSHISNTSFRQACYAADVAFRVYFDDVKKLVREGVTAATTPLFRLEDQLTRQSAWERLTALGHWMDERHPLSYMPGILSNLLQVILAPNERKFELTTLMLGKKPTSFITDIMIKQCSKVMAHNIPLFIKGGNFIHSTSAMAYQASQAIQAGDAHGEWSAMDVRLTSFNTVLHKINLPKYLEKLDWVERDWKGNKEHSRFITMVSGFIICLCGDLKEWWAKHTAKGINVFLLVHLGLASIEMASGFQSAKWTVDIKPCGGDKIVMRHAEVVRLMKSGGTYGGFDAVRYLAGMKAANILQMNQFMMARALPGMAQASTSSKRSREEWDEGHDDNGIIPCGSHGTQQKASRHD
ncbi:hypothetical protein EDC04DRAFT_2604217 [Pisolithus marmoratus]|nr:hypothetical protein EDC04DRAFT_2604217 [Pisolithus marmoratus]